MGLLRPAALLLLLLLAPAAAGQGGEPLCIITLQPSGDFHNLTMVLDLVVNDTDLAALVRAVDADGDGTITPAEVARHENGSAVQVTQREGHDRALTLDGRPGDLTYRTNLEGFEGPVAGGGARKVQEVRAYAFEVVYDDPWHRLEGGSGAREYGRAVVETVVVTAPADWVVWSINGTKHRAPQVTVQGFDTHTFYVVQFAQAGYDLDHPPRPWLPTPAPSALLAAGLTAAAALALRRRP